MTTTAPAAPVREQPDLRAVPDAEQAQPMGLWRKIAFVQAHAGHVEKTGRVSFGKTRFDHMQEHGLLKVLKPLLSEVGLAVTSNVAGWHMDGNTYVIDFQLVVTDIETGEQVVASYPNVGVDSSDKGINKALTGAHKYALQKFFLVPTEDIDENETVDQDSRRSTARVSARTAPGPNTISAGELATLRESALEAIQAGHLSNSDVTGRLRSSYGVAKLDELTKAQAAEFADWLVARVKGDG